MSTLWALSLPGQAVSADTARFGQSRPLVSAGSRHHLFATLLYEMSEVLPDVPTSTLDFTFLIRYIRCLTSIDMLALDCGGHHDVATAQTSQRLSRRLPEAATRKSVS